MSTQHAPVGDAPTQVFPGDGQDRPDGAARTTVRVLGGLAALALVAGAAATTTRDMWVGGGGEGTRTELPAGITALTIDASSAEVRVRPVRPGERPGVTSTWRATSEDPTVVTPDADGRTATVDVHCRGWFVLGAGGADDCGTQVEVRVPAGTRVDADSDVGILDVADLTGQLTLRTDAGEIHVAGSRGALDLSTDVGTIDVTRSRSTQVRATSSVGEVTVASLAAPERLTVSTDVGSFEVTLPDDGTSYAVHRDVGLGELRVDVPQEATSGHVLDLGVSAGSGRVARD